MPEKAEINEWKEEMLNEMKTELKYTIRYFIL